MVKPGEVDYTLDDIQLDSKGYTKGISSRPRAICTPEDKGVGIIHAL
jgi:hypothetical protein